jgi:hypothetical protein
VDPAIDLDRQAFLRPFIGDCQALKLLRWALSDSALRTIEHEVVGPHLIGTVGTSGLDQPLAMRLRGGRS